MILAVAMVLDALLGEPKLLWNRVPHPAILMGHAIGWLDQRLNKDGAKKPKGIAAMILLGSGAVLLGLVLQYLGPLVQIAVATVFLAQRSLVDHVRAVADGLRVSTGDGRRAVAMIVGRDTAQMDGPSVARGAIESAAENLSDGVIAPIFWFAVAGLPGLLLYKVTNTADSMIGYRNARYEQFGWAAARFDDLLNLIPARLTALLTVATHGLWRKWSEIAQEAPMHRSPNAGWPEAAMARVLGVALAGPRSYDGQLRDFPYVNETGKKQIGPEQIDATCRALWRVWGGALALVLLGAVVTG